ncbi:MAG: hypothetical protein MR355_09045 [Lachnospiraceae bacterium]|nr:hypothetical protein [Lachnospiraceae bacterium]
MTIYEKLQSLQHIEHAYENWTDYRNVMTNYILTHTGMDSTLAIFGAGMCNDIDLSLLAGHFKQITLIDSDAAAMNAAKERYGLEDYPRIPCSVCDLTGISSRRYEEFSDLLLDQIKIFGTSIDMELLSDCAISYLHDVYDHLPAQPVVFAADSFDYSMAFGLHSQLNNMFAWIYDAVTASLPKRDTSVHRYIASQTKDIVKKANNTIFHCTKKAAFFANERMSTASDTPIAGAYDCILDVKDRYPDCTAAMVNWPFAPDRGIIYQMLLQTVEL